MTVDQIVELIEKETAPAKMSKQNAADFMGRIRDELAMRIEGIECDIANEEGGE